MIPLNQEKFLREYKELCIKYKCEVVSEDSFWIDDFQNDDDMLFKYVKEETEDRRKRYS